MAGIWIPWLADAARLTGYPVNELVGWRSRGTGGAAGAMNAVEVVVCHHTAGGKTGEAPSLAVVRDGRAGLSGPLSHYVLGRSGTVYVVAAGACNHAGTSSWAGISGLNSRAIGIEAEDDGDGRWTPEQLDCYPRLVAACLYYMRRDASRAAAHREVAIPAGRKIDPAGIDMAAFRARVAQLLTDPLRLIPRGAPTAQEDQLSWTTPLADYYTGNPDDRLPAGEMLAWGTTHAANARDAARDAVARVAKLESKIDALMTRVVSGAPTGGPAALSEADLDRIAARVVALLGRKTSAP